MSGRGPAAPAAPPPSRPPIQEAAPLSRPAQGAPARLGAHVPRLLQPACWTLCVQAAEPQSSSSSGSSCGPSRSALGRRQRCSAERRRDPHRKTSATPKVKSWRPAPGSARSPTAVALRRRLSQTPQEGGGVGTGGRGGEHHAVCILGHTANAPGAGPGRNGEPRRRGGRAQGQAAPKAR